MKIKILKIVIPLLLVLLIQNELSAQGAKSKKPGSTDKNGNERVNTEESVESEDKTESSTENYDVDQTEVIINDYVKGEPIELYDLINMFLPDEEVTAEEFDWDKGDHIKAIQWKQKEEGNPKGYFYKQGDLRMTIGGKEYNFSRESKYQFKWHLGLSGSKNGFSQFGVSSDIAFYEYEVTLDYLFPGRNFEAKLLEENDKYGGKGAEYEIIFPGKRKFWLSASTSGGSHGNTLSIDCFFNKNDLDKY